MHVGQGENCRPEGRNRSATSMCGSLNGLLGGGLTVSAWLTSESLGKQENRVLWAWGWEPPRITLSASDRRQMGSHLRARSRKAGQPVVEACPAAKVGTKKPGGCLDTGKPKL